jgi:hypothetical protein
MSPCRSNRTRKPIIPFKDKATQTPSRVSLKPTAEDAPKPVNEPTAALTDRLSELRLQTTIDEGPQKTSSVSQAMKGLRSCGIYLSLKRHTGKSFLNSQMTSLAELGSIATIKQSNYSLSKVQRSCGSRRLLVLNPTHFNYLRGESSWQMQSTTRLEMSIIAYFTQVGIAAGIKYNVPVTASTAQRSSDSQSIVNTVLHVDLPLSKAKSSQSFLLALVRGYKSISLTCV